jgi:hypothetical protein
VQAADWQVLGTAWRAAWRRSGGSTCAECRWRRAREHDLECEGACWSSVTWVLPTARGRPCEQHTSREDEWIWRHLGARKSASRAVRRAQALQALRDSWILFKPLSLIGVCMCTSALRCETRSTAPGPNELFQRRTRSKGVAVTPQN